MNSLELMKRLPSLEAFSPEELDVLDRVLVARRHRKGELLVTEGSSSDGLHASMFLILRGEVEVTSGRGTQRVVLARLQPGDVCGAMSIIAPAPRSATCRAVDDLVTAELTRLVWDELVRSETGVAARFQLHVARQLARDLRRLTGHVKLASAGDPSALREHFGLPN